jgi:hypothetical protein
VASGPEIIQPDFPEMKEPWLHVRQQSGSAISGAADYVFCVLAADWLLKNSP